MDWFVEALRQAGIEGVADSLASVICYAMQRASGRTLTNEQCAEIRSLLMIVEDLRFKARG